MVQPSSARPDVVMITRGGAIGLAAFGVGYVLTYAWRAPAVSDSLRGLNFLATVLGVEAIPTWKGVAWVFYGAHGVATRFPTAGGGTQLINMVEQTGNGMVALLYVLVPILLLLAGAAAAWLADPDSPVEATVTGAAVAAGYLVAAAIGTVLFAHAIGDSGASIAPDPITGVLLAGLLYPFVLGALGGLLASYA